MTEHGMHIECRDDGWWYARCDCGWESVNRCPGRATAADEWADHMQDVEP